MVKLNEDDDEIMEYKEPKPDKEVAKYCQFPHEGVGAISVTNEDYACLEVEVFFNDIVIDFYLQFLQFEIFKNMTEVRDKTHIFSTYFFDRLSKPHPYKEDDPSLSLAEKRYERIRNWTKKVNLFDKDYIVVPINKDAHWFVCVICFPGQLGWSDEAAKAAAPTQMQPCILIFDSLDGGKKAQAQARTCRILREFLASEWKETKKDQEARTFNENNMPGCSPEVPQQPNLTDCGPYMLKNVESFFKKPIADFTLPITTLRTWFPEEEVRNMRSMIADIIRTLAVQQNPGKEFSFPEILFQVEGNDEVEEDEVSIQNYQWSPMNLEGKKQYDREFLIKLQYGSLSLTKPEHLPNIEIVKDKPVMQVKPRVINISQDVKLHEAENAYRAGPKKSKVEGGDFSEEDELEKLRKKVRSILNKLTPQKFDKLVDSFKDLPINSGPKLELSMALIFEKAVDEPSFSVAYAQMCQTLNKIEVPSAEGQSTVKFRTLLISRVQEEFERDYMKNVDKDGYEAKMKDPNLTANEKKKEKALYEAMEIKARRRSLGNIRFIGELYNLNMLTVKIMHGCVRRLLKTTDDESLECLCRLVTTVGQNFERQTNDLFKTTPKEKQGGLKEIPVYINEMKKIIANKTTSARVRFLMQDVVDLKNNQWRKLREDVCPKTLQQIRADVKMEQLNQSLMNSAPLPIDSGRDHNRRGDRRSGDWGPSHTQLPTCDDTLDKVDTNKLRSIGHNEVDADTIQLAPRRDGFSSWGHGSSGAGGRDSDNGAQLLHYVKAGVQAGGSGRPGNPPPGLSRPWQQLNLLHKLKATAESGGVTAAALSASMMVPPKTVVSAPKIKSEREDIYHPQPFVGFSSKDQGKREGLGSSRDSISEIDLKFHFRMERIASLGRAPATLCPSPLTPKIWLYTPSLSAEFHREKEL